MEDNYTRRAFLSGRPIRDAVEDGTEAGDGSNGQSEQARSPHTDPRNDTGSTGRFRSWLVPAVFRVAAVAVLLIALGQLAGVGLADTVGASTTGVVAAQDGDPAAQCDPPTADRQTAHDRLERLRQLDAEAAVDVPAESLRAVQRQVEDGDSSYSLREYCDAGEAYRAAIEQATPTLKEEYRDGASHHLDAAAAMVAAERADPNPDPDAGALAVEIERERGALADASSVAELADRYESAVALRADANARLPTEPHEQLVEAFLENRAITGYAAVVTVLAGGLVSRQWWTDDENSSPIPDTPR